MPTVDLPGGTSLYTGATNSDYPPFVQAGVTIPTGRTMADGGKQILVYRIYAYAGGYGGSVTVSLQLGSYKTANFSVGSGTATNTGWRTIDALMNPGTNTFRLNASNRVYIGRSNGGSPQLQDDIGNTWAGQAVGAYSYYQAPTQPTGLVDSDNTYTSAVLEWDAPSDNGGTAITGYRLQVATNSSFSGATTYNQTSRTKTLTGLVAGTTYYARVAAKNDVTDAAGTTSVWSNTRAFTLPDYTIPSAPRTPAVASSTPTSATITWTAPSSNGGTPITSYTLQHSLSPTFASGITTITGVTSPKVVTGLTPDTHVYFRVAAVNAVGTGPWSATVDADLTGAPSAPPNFHVVESLPTAVTVAWDVPVDDGGSALTGYRLERSTSPSFSSPTTVDVGLSPLEYQFTGLDVNTTYYFRVAGRNAATLAGAAFKWSSLSETTTGVIKILMGGVWVPHRPHVLRTGAWADLIPHSLDGGAWNPPA